MQASATEIDQMIVQLNEFILPSSLMESFDVYREESVKSAARCFNDAQLSWFLDMLNRFRGPDDRKDSLVDIFDPGMYTCDHPAWEAAPGTRIEMPALTSEVARLADRNSELVEIAEEEINEFRDHAETYADDEILGLARIAASALVDRGRTFHGREEAIRYRLAFPTGAYYTWKGSVLEGTPIEPDQSIAFDWREARHGHDRQLKHSIKLLENTPTQLSFREA